MAGQHVRFRIRDPGLRACVRSGIGLFGGAPRVEAGRVVPEYFSLEMATDRSAYQYPVRWCLDLAPLSSTLRGARHQRVEPGSTAPDITVDITWIFRFFSLLPPALPVRFWPAATRRSCCTSSCRRR